MSCLNAMRCVRCVRHALRCVAPRGDEPAVEKGTITSTIMGPSSQCKQAILWLDCWEGHAHGDQVYAGNKYVRHKLSIIFHLNTPIWAPHQHLTFSYVSLQYTKQNTYTTACCLPGTWCWFHHAVTSTARSLAYSSVSSMHPAPFGPLTLLILTLLLFSFLLIVFTGRSGTVRSLRKHPSSRFSSCHEDGTDLYPQSSLYIYSSYWKRKSMGRGKKGEPNLIHVRHLRRRECTTKRWRATAKVLSIFTILSFSFLICSLLFCYLFIFVSFFHS